MLKNQQDAEDIVQSLFIDLHAKRRTDVTLAYLYQAVTRRCLNRLRDQKRRRALLDQHGESLVMVRHGDIAERAISLDLLTQLLDQLDDTLSDVFVYLFLDHMTQSEAADLIGTSRKTVGHRLARIREVLTSLLEAP